MKLTKKIILYLDGEMKGQELSDFETQIQKNEELLKLINLHKEINESILDEETVSFRKKLSELYSVFRKNKKKSIPYKLKRVMKFATAASVIFIISVGIYNFLIKDKSSENIYNDNFSPYNSDIITRSDLSSNKELNKAIYHYQNKEYQTAYEIFDNYLEKNHENPVANFYFGITAMELENYNTAVSHLQYVINDTTNLYKTHAQWYLTLCYLELENIELAKCQLKELVNSNTQYKLKAQEILKKIY